MAWTTRGRASWSRLSAPDRWFSYYWWEDDAKAPDYARTVDIHRKPGYDPMELFIDPKLPAAKLRLGLKLLSRKLGQRALLDVIPIRGTSLVKGSHGLLTDDPMDGPLVISDMPELMPPEGTPVAATGFKGLVLNHVFGDGAGRPSSAGARRSSQDS